MPLLSGVEVHFFVLLNRLFFYVIMKSSLKLTAFLLLALSCTQLCHACDFEVNGILR